MKHILIIVMIILAGFFVCATEVEQGYREKECTMENVYQAIRDCGIEHPHVVFAQMMIESAGFDSKLAKTNKNIAGMRLPIKRQTTAIGKQGGYALYADWFSSVHDYLLYQQNVFGGHKVNDKQYLAKLSKKYAEDPKYKQKIALKLKDEDLNEFYRIQDSTFEARQPAPEIIVSNP